MVDDQSRFQEWVQLAQCSQLWWAGKLQPSTFSTWWNKTGSILKRTRQRIGYNNRNMHKISKHTSHVIISQHIPLLKTYLANCIIMPNIIVWWYIVYIIRTSRHYIMTYIQPLLHNYLYYLLQPRHVWCKCTLFLIKQPPHTTAQKVEMNLHQPQLTHVQLRTVQYLERKITLLNKLYLPSYIEQATPLGTKTFCHRVPCPWPKGTDSTGFGCHSGHFWGFKSSIANVSKSSHMLHAILR